MQRLNILFIAGWYPTPDSPASGIFVRENARAVSLYNNVVVVYSPKNGSSGCDGIYDQMEDGIRTIRTKHWLSPIPKTSAFLHFLRTRTAFRKLLKEGWKPDVIHAHVYSAGVSAVILGKIYRIPVVITEHYSGFPRHLLSRTAILKARFAMNMADVVLSVSDNLRKHIQSYGIHNRFEVVPNVVDTKFFFPESKPAERTVKRLLLPALLNPVKGVPYLLRSLAQVRQDRQDFVLDIVGDGPARAECEQLTEELGLTKFVTFHGLKPKAEVAEFMRRCDFVVLSSQWENLPCVLLETLSCGKPGIATKVGGIPEIISERTGLLVPPKDVNALAEAVNYMLDHYQDYSAQEIAQYARERYSYEAVGKTLDRIYRDIAACKRE